MLTLYVKTSCPFCEKVLRRAEELNIPLETRDIAEPRNLDELLEKGGKRQVPFLVDDETSTSLYESDDIVRYLEDRAR